MAIELDHFFVCASHGGQEASTLVQFGLSEGTRNVHPGQGTACRRFFFCNAYLELLWVTDPAEAQSSLIRPTHLWERWLGRDHGACPFGLVFRPATKDHGGVPFQAWEYRPPYLPESLSLHVGTNADVLTEPLLFYLPLTRRPALAGIIAGYFFSMSHPQQMGPVPVGTSYLGRFSGAMWQQIPGQGFLLTNHAMKCLRVSISSFQVREGASWTKRACSGPFIELSPCGTGRLTIDLAAQSCAPTTNTWRVELRVAERLSSAEGFLQGIRRFPTVLEGVLRGVLPPSCLIRQFAGTWYGHERFMFTPEFQAYQFDQTPDHEAFNGP